MDLILVNTDYIWLKPLFVNDIYTHDINVVPNDLNKINNLQLITHNS